MKRVISLFSALLLVTGLLCSPAFAAPGTYKLDELELQVTIPTGYTVITRNTPASDPIFSKYGTTKATLLDHFEKNNIYLNALSNNHNEEIVVTMMETYMSNFSLLGDTALNTLASALVNEYTNLGINVLKQEIHQHSQAKFVKVYFMDSVNSVWGLQYYTIYNGKAMNFTMRSYEGSLSSRQETVIQTIIDSLIYDNAPPASDPPKDIDSFTYTDAESGVTFTLPANWEQKELSKDREFIDVNFVSTKDNGCMIVYGSSDLWNTLSPVEKFTFTRSDINNSLFTKEDVAVMCNTTEDNISTVTYNGVQYFIGEASYSNDTYGVDFSVTMTNLIYINNGWMYMFQFGGTSSHKLYSDFEALLNSVEYPAASNTPENNSPAEPLSPPKKNVVDNGIGEVIVAVLLVIVAVIVIAVVVSRKKRNKMIKEISDTPAPQLQSSDETSTMCQNCGYSLPPNSTFCHMCGSQIIREDTPQQKL